MPELNLANPAVRDVLYRQSGSVVQHWLAPGRGQLALRCGAGRGYSSGARDANGSRGSLSDAGLLGELNGFFGAWFQAGGGYQGMR